MTPHYAAPEVVQAVLQYPRIMAVKAVQHTCPGRSRNSGSSPSALNSITSELAAKKRGGLTDVGVYRDRRPSVGKNKKTSQWQTPGGGGGTFCGVIQNDPTDKPEMCAAQPLPACLSS